MIEAQYILDLSKIKEKRLEVNSENICINLLMNFINENFSNINKKIRLFHFFGMEILEDSDLVNFYGDIVRHRIVFFTRNNENFESGKIMRLFKFLRKLGEVILSILILIFIFGLVLISLLTAVVNSKTIL